MTPQHGLAENGNYLARAEAKSEQLERLIDDLFAFTRLEHLGEQPQLGRVSLGELLRQAAAAVELLATRKRITLSIDGGDAVRVGADGHHLERVVANLVDNASPTVRRAGSSASAGVATTPRRGSRSPTAAKGFPTRRYRTSSSRSSGPTELAGGAASGSGWRSPIVCSI